MVFVASLLWSCHIGGIYISVLRADGSISMTLTQQNKRKVISSQSARLTLLNRMERQRNLFDVADATGATDMK